MTAVVVLAVALAVVVVVVVVTFLLRGPSSLHLSRIDHKFFFWSIGAGDKICVILVMSSDEQSKKQFAFHEIFLGIVFGTFDFCFLHSASGSGRN